MYILKHPPDFRDLPGKRYDYNGPHYFANLGDHWPSNPNRRLIARTVRDPAEAKQFATEAEAQEVLAITEARGREIVEA